jgi:hypothetical protein
VKADAHRTTDVPIPMAATVRDEKCMPSVSMFAEYSGRCRLAGRKRRETEHQTCRCGTTESAKERATAFNDHWAAFLLLR